MSDLISRSALLERFGECEFLFGCLVHVIIKEAPAVDATPKWISVEERLPENNELVLFFADKPMPTMDTAYGLWVKTNRNYNVTHWMPLPEPPKEDT